MDKPISVGDLVVMVRTCNDCECDGLGVPFRVTAIDKTKTIYCDDYVNAEGYGGVEGFKDYAIPISWVKRIPPLGELEGEKRDEKLTEPA